MADLQLRDIKYGKVPDNYDPKTLTEILREMLRDIQQQLSMSDNSGSGYFRIGTMQICWGSVSITTDASGNGSATATFAAAFKDTTFKVIASDTRTDTIGLVAAPSSSTTTSIIQMRSGGNALAHGVNYLAIGVYK